MEIYRTGDMKDIRKADDSIISKYKTVVDIYKRLLLQSLSNIVFKNTDVDETAKISLEKSGIEAQALRARIEHVRFKETNSNVFSFIRLNVYGDRCKAVDASTEVIFKKNMVYYPFPAVDIILNGNTVRINSYSSKYRFYIWRQVKLRDYRDFAKAMKNYPDTVSSAIFFVYTSEDYFKLYHT